MNIVPQFSSKIQPHYSPWLQWLLDFIRAVAAIDTVWVLTHRYWPAFEEELNDSLQADTKQVKVKRIKNPWTKKIIWRVYRITKPTVRTYAVMRKWRAYLAESENYPKPRDEFLVCRVDVSVDFWFTNWGSFYEFKRRCAISLGLRWPTKLEGKPNKGFWYKTTRYFVDYRHRPHIRRKKHRRTMILYENKEGKKAIRLELKLHNTASVRANQLLDIDSEFPYISPRALFTKHVSEKQLKPHWLAKKVKAALARDGIRNSGTWPRWRQILPGRVVHDYDSWMHDDPNHPLPMVKAKGNPLCQLIPTKLLTPD
jgi:hypothetical protein